MANVLGIQSKHTRIARDVENAIGNKFKYLMFKRGQIDRIQIREKIQMLRNRIPSESLQKSLSIHPGDPVLVHSSNVDISSEFH